MTTPNDAPALPEPAPGWRMGSLRGVPVYLGRSWPVVALVIVLTFAPGIMRALPGLGAGAYGVALAYALLLLASVLAHEAGHALVAQAFGHRVDRIVADLWGGHTTYQATTNTPGRSALVAVAGPAMNVLLGAGAYLLLPHVGGGVVGLLVGALLYSNVFVALFNLLPGLPLDGGFLVDSLVWKVTGSRATGQLVAGWTGRLVTVGVVLWFLVLPWLRGDAPDLFSVVWMALVCSFLWHGATAAVRGAHVQRRTDRVDVRSLVRPTVLVPHDTPLAQAYALPAPEGAIPVVVDDRGRVLGLLGEPQDVPAHLVASTPAGAVTIALPADGVLPWREDLTTADVLQAMARAQVGVVLVADGHGRYGAVTGTDVVDRAGLA